MKHFDNQLIKKIKEQDHTAFNIFYLETVDIFFRYIETNYFINHQDAQDLISDFYVKFWESVKKFDENQSFNGYFRTIFKNMIKDFFKKNHDIPFTELETQEQDIAFEETLVDDQDVRMLINNDFQLEHIKKAMKELDDISKDIIYRKFIEERTNEEIEAIVGISNENVRQKVSRAIKQLKKLLESDL